VARMRRRRRRVKKTAESKLGASTIALAADSPISRVRSGPVEV